MLLQQTYALCDQNQPIGIQTPNEINLLSYNPQQSIRYNSSPLIGKFWYAQIGLCRLAQTQNCQKRGLLPLKST